LKRYVKVLFVPARKVLKSLLASYTYGKSLDQSSSIQEQVYPYNYREDYAPSAFDIKHNFVVSYNYELPFAKLSGKANRLTDGW
jgi:hypothetical protein